MNSKQLNIFLGVVIVILIGVLGYMVLRDNPQAEISREQNTTINPNIAPSDANNAAPTPDASPVSSESNSTAGWKTYTNSGTGLSFKYPSTWTVGAYNAAPNLEVNSFLISTLPVECGELGRCQQYELSNKQVIEEGKMSGIIPFNGGKGSLIATCSGNEGGNNTPTPFYKFSFFKGDRVYELTLNDLSTKLSASTNCDSSKYIQDLVKAIPNPIMDAKYEVYGDLLTLIKQTLTLK